MKRPKLQLLREASDRLDRRHPKKGYGLEMRRAIRYLHHLEKKVIRLQARPSPEAMRAAALARLPQEKHPAGLMLFGDSLRS